MLVRFIIMLVFLFAMQYFYVILLLFSAASAFSVVLAVFDAMLLLFNAMPSTAEFGGVGMDRAPHFLRLRIRLISFRCVGASWGQCPYAYAFNWFASGGGARRGQ